jgi:hypothetical protein
MHDATAGKLAGTTQNAHHDPMGRTDAENRKLTTEAPGQIPVPAEDRDPTAGRAAGTAWNAKHDPTRARPR